MRYQNRIDRMGTTSSDNQSTGLFNSGKITRLNVLSTMVQAGYALKKGNKRRAALLFGAALLASRQYKLSYAIQGAVILNDVKKLVQ